MSTTHKLSFTTTNGKTYRIPGTRDELWSISDKLDRGELVTIRTPSETLDFDQRHITSTKVIEEV